MASFHERIQWATAVAQRALRRPTWYLLSVTTDPQAGTEILDCGYRDLRRRWLRSSVLQVCMVTVGDSQDTARVVSSGAFAAADQKMAASIRELSTQDVGVEPGDAWLAAERIAGGKRGRRMNVALLNHEGTQAWQAVIDDPGFGVHTVIIASADGRKLLHKIDREFPST